MDKTLANVLGADGLPAELLTSLQEAFDKKVAEAREEAEMSIRSEFAARYEHDKNNLVEAMDRMLTDVVKKTEMEKADAVAKLKEAKGKLDKAIKESRKYYKAKLAEHIDATSTFVTKQLSKNIKSLAEAKASHNKKKSQLAESFEALKAEMAKEQAARLKKIDEFVVRATTRELKEFEQDHRALVETRVKLVKESKAKLAETQARFVKEAAKKVESTINETLKQEMTQLHEDLERNRQNQFGRRIFEAVAAEFMTSYIAEGTEIRKLQTVLESKEQELAKLSAKLDETVKATEVSSRKAKLAEDRAARTKIMSELLSNLRGDKRSVMESMLETTKTEHLRSAFDRLLPVVLSEGTRKPQAEKKALTESPRTTERRFVSVTGDKSNRLYESAQSETDAQIENDAEIGQIIRLAGITK